MYKVLKNGRTTRKGFNTYEQARQYVRKVIRSLPGLGMWRFRGTTNPPIGTFGYSITKA